jgi:hypothetical protein
MSVVNTRDGGHADGPRSACVTDIHLAESLLEGLSLDLT